MLFFLAVWLNAQDMSWFLIFWKDKINLETHKESLLATLTIIDISLRFIGEVLHNRKGSIKSRSLKHSVIMIFLWLFFHFI